MQRRTGHRELTITRENRRSTDPSALGHATTTAPRLITQQNGGHDSPPLYKVLPNVITQPIGVGKFLDEVFDGVLSEPEKVGTGDRVGVLTIADRVRLLDDR